MFKFILKYFKKHRKIFFLDISCATLVAMIDLTFPMFSRYAMYTMLPGKHYEAFFKLMFTILFFFILRSFAYYIMVYLGHTFGVRVETDIRRDLFIHMQSLDHEFYDNNKVGVLMSRLTSDLFELTELSHHGPEDVFISIVTIIGAIILMFTINVHLAFVVSLMVPIFLIIVMKERKSMGLTGKEVKKKIADVNASIESSISGIRTSKAFSNEDIDLERFDKSNMNYRLARKSFFQSMGRFMGFQELFMGTLPVVTMTYGGYLIMKGQLNYIDLVTFTLFVATFINPIRKMANFAEIYTNGMAGFRRFYEIIKIQPSIPETKDNKTLNLTKGEIEFKNVDFAYSDDLNRLILKNINLKIKPSEYLALVGSSGGGKTTLSNLIPRFYDTLRGEILIDGQNIKSVTKKSLRKNIGIVEQDVFIFNDTVYENIKYGNPKATKEEIIEASKKAKIYDDIMKMKYKFDTIVGDKGTKLSGGQKQRISIARIFLKNPKILILDEATSALDTITEKEISESLDNLQKGRTSIVIAHRLSTIQNADRIILIEEGSIVEQGTHEELINKKGKYNMLFESQNLLN